MKKISVVLLLFLFAANTVFPCGPGFLTPIFEYKHAPENPYENFAAGRIGVLKPTYRRIVLFAAYRYLNNGSFSADEQKGLVDVWNAEFNNKSFQNDDDVGAAVKAWVEKRKNVVEKEEKLPEIYVERTYGGYEFFPNCTKNAFETATQTLSDRISSYGSDDKDVKAWVAAQDKVFTNCDSGNQTPDAPDASMPEWLQKDRAYQMAAAEFYSLDYEKAKNHFKEIAADTSSPWQETADYLVGRTLIRQASLTKDAAKVAQFYTEAEEHLQIVSAKSGKFSDSAEKLLGLIKYRLHPKERVGELARSLSYAGTPNFRQNLIDYSWLIDKFEKESLEAEEKRKEELKSKENNANSNLKGDTNPSSNIYDQVENGEIILISFTNSGKTDSDPSKYSNYTFKPDATDEEIFNRIQTDIARNLTESEIAEIRKQKESALIRYKYVTSPNYKFSRKAAPEYQGGYYGSEESSLSLLPEFLRQDDLTDWLFTFQIKNTEAYLYSLSKFRQNGSDLWLMTALSKADKNSSELNRLLEASAETSPSSPAYPTIAYHTARILIEQDKLNEAGKLLDEVLASSTNLPVSSRNQFLELRLKLAETLESFLKFAQRRPFAFDWDGYTSLSIDEIIAEQKTWYNAEYETVSKEEYDRNVEEGYKEERLWQDRLMFDDKTIAIINEHFPLAVLIEAEKSPALPDYLKKRFALAIWTRAVILEDFPTATRIAPDVIKYFPEAEELMNQFLAAKTLPAKRYAAIYLILKNTNLTPYISSGMGTAAENYKMYATQWWCTPYDGYYDEEAEEFVSGKLPQKPLFLTAAQSDTAQKELAKLKQMGDAPKFFGAKVLEWARLSPADKRLPESLFIVFEANGWDKYGCGNDEELRNEIGNVLKKRYPKSEEAQQVIAQESESQ